MENFEFHAPTKVIFGKETEALAGKEVKSLGGSRVLLHYGGASAKKSGLIDKVKASLEQEGLFYAELSGVVPNPRLSKVREGVELCKKLEIDFILAVGGGSVMDSAKAIALGAENDGDVWDFFLRLRAPGKSLPVGVVVTLAASGSETSDSMVITNEDGWLKRGLSLQQNRPRFAIMNPELTYAMPPYQTACGIVDIMMHTMERYFSNTMDADFTDRISEGVLMSVIKAGETAMKCPEDYTARANLMWAGSISHNGLTGLGKLTGFSVHQLQHELGGKYDVAHAAGLSAMWGHWARYVMDENIMRFAQYATRVWGLPMDFASPRSCALRGIERTEEYFKSIGMPTNLKELGVQPTAEDIHELSDKCTFFGARKIPGLKVLDYADIKAIYEAAAL